MSKLIKICYSYQILILIFLILINTDCLKHSTNKNKQQLMQKSVSSQNNNVQLEKSTHNKQITKNEERTQNKNNKDTKKVNAQKHAQNKLGYQFVIEPKQNEYVIPITIDSDSYNLGLFFDQKQSQYGSIPSWFFTSLTANDHQLCDTEGSCQQVTKFINCKDNDNCTDIGASKFSSQIMKSQRKVKINFVTNNSYYSMQFVSPKKVIFPSDDIKQNSIHGMLNLALNSELKYGNQIILSKNIVKILNQSQFQKQISKNKEIIQFDKGSRFSLSMKDIYLQVVGTNDKNIVSNIKLTYQKCKIKFSNNNMTMAVPQKALTTIINLLKKHYFGDRCKILDDAISCSGAPLKNIQNISFCHDNKGKKCVSLPVLGYILQELITDKSYKLLITENEDKDGDATFVFYPPIAQIYTIFGQKGLIKGILPISDSIQLQQSNEEKKTHESSIKQQQQKKIGQAQHQTKEIKPQKQQQSKKQKSISSKEIKTQKQQQSKKQKSEKSKHQQQQEQKEQQSEQTEDQQNSESSTLLQKKPQHALEKTVNSIQNVQTEDQKYSKHLFFFICVYGLIFVLILIVIKLKSQESLAAKMIDQCLEITWYGIVKNYFNKSRGYNTPKLEEECGGGEQQIDHSDSVTVGYTEQQGRQLFWQKNSIEGI